MTPLYKGSVGTMVFTLAMFLAPAAYGQASDRLEGPVPEEVSAFNEASARFADRAREMRQDTNDFVDFRENQERTALTAGYDSILDSLDELQRNQRDLAVQRFNEFLSKYPDSEYSSHVRFRLADLYFEIEQAEWLVKAEEYFELLNRDDLSLEEAEDLEMMGEPKLDLSRPVALYKRIVADNRNLPKDEQYERLDGVYLMLGFCYSEENAALPEPDYPTALELGEEAPPFDPDSWEQVIDRKSVLAKATFREFIEAMPESELADRAHLFLGNFLFDEGDFEGAVAEYEFVYNKGEDGPYFDESIYQLAWANYKKDNYDRAIPLFTEVLDRSVTLKEETGKESAFRTDAVRYMAFSFADQGAERYNALEVAKSYFTRIGEREYEWDVYTEMGDGLMRYARFDEAVEVYANLQSDPRWVNRPENPEFQMEIVKLFGNVALIGDLERSGEERIVLTTRYNEGTEWWEANRNNPDALAVARGFIESSLGQVAQELRVRAQESEQPADYLIAADKYQEYLDKFPISDDYYEVQWLLADSLYKGESFERALAEYNSLVRSANFHVYQDGALVRRLQIQFDRVLAQGPPGDLPENAEVDRTYTASGGKEVTVYKLSKERMEFIEAADAVLGHEFSEPAPDVPDFSGWISTSRPALIYIPGQILDAHNRYDEARPRLERIISEFPRRDEASYAATELVNSYLEEGNLDEVRALTTRFTATILGSSDIADPEGKFQDIKEGAVFKQAKALGESGDSIEAADAYMAFLEEFPDSNVRESALYNAAFFYQQGGKADQANQLYEEFINKYPDHELSEDLYFRIATLYESTLQLDKAVAYYKDMAARFPDAENAPTATYNAAYLQTGLGQHRAAAEGLESYGTTFPDLEDAEKTYFRAGEQWEAVSTRDALAFYDRYLKKFGLENPDNAITAMARRADLNKSEGRNRAYESELDRIEKAFDDVVNGGGEVGPLAHKYAAKAAYRGLKEAYDSFAETKLTRNDDKDIKILEEAKAEVKVVEDRAKAFAGKYENFEYSSAALLIVAKAPLVYADLGLSIDCPKALSEDDCYSYLDILEEKVYPQYRTVEEEIGIPRLVDLVTKAKDLKRHSPSIDEALAELNRRLPTDYPALKVEIEGEADSSAPPRIVGVDAKKPKAVEEGE